MINLIDIQKIYTKNMKTSRKIKVTDQIKDLGMDSLDLVEMTMHIEKEFYINFEAGEVEGMSTVGDIIALTNEKIYAERT